MFSFVRLCGVMQKSFFVDKKEHPSQLAIKQKLANELGAFLRENLGYFQGFRKVIVYYDNGQKMMMVSQYGI